MITEIGDLNSLYCYWYQTGKYRDISNLKIPVPNLPEQHLLKLWKDVWHSQSELQKKVDQDLQIYKEFIRETSKEFADSKTFEENFGKYGIFQQITLIILFDQIPRNIFRKTAEAYQYDSISNKMVKILLGKYNIIEDFPIQFICKLLCCLNHAEVKEDHLLVENYLKKLQEKYQKNYYEIQAELMGSHEDHYYRIQEFGRIPERNAYLGRESTEKELTYLKSIS